MTETARPDDLQQRVERLETEIRSLKQALNRLSSRLPEPTSLPPQTAEVVSDKPRLATPARGSSTPPPPPSGRPSPPLAQATVPKQPAGPRFSIPERMRTFDYWLNRIGIGLLLFGIAFLFKYSIDQGWITPWLRIAFALAVGAVLAGLSFRLHGSRRPFATILLGGAIAIWYIAGFSAFQLLQLISHPQALSFMVGVTLFAFAISLRQNEPVLSLIGTLGGFGTPFLLYTGSGNLPGLMAYTSLLIALTGGLFFFKGWKSLLWLTVISGWTVIAIGISNHTWVRSETGNPEQWSLQGGIVLCWIVFSFVPLVRELVWLKNPDRWVRSTIGFADKSLSDKTRALLDRHLHLLAFSSPLISYFLSMIIWPGMIDNSRGWIAIGIAALYLAISFGLFRKKELRGVSYSNALVTIFFTTIGLGFLLDGDTLLLAFATEAMALHWIATRLNSLSIRFTAHFVSWFTAVWLWSRLTSDLDNAKPFWGSDSLADIWGIITLGFSSIAIRKKISGQVYGLATALILWLLIVRQFTGNVELGLIGLEALAVYLIGRVSFKNGIYYGAHLFYMAAIGAVVVRYLNPISGLTPLLNLDALGNLFIVALLLLPTVSDEHKFVRWTYALVAHLSLLGLFSSEFSRFENGQGLVSLAWGVYGIILLLIGLRKNLYQSRLVAMGTLILLVFKLFLIDLARLETIWRVLLFIGVGGAFLVLSYFFPALWKDQPQTTDLPKSQETS